AFKLRDLATLLQSYLDWLQERNLHDADCLLPAAAAALQMTTGPRQRKRVAEAPMAGDTFLIGTGPNPPEVARPGEDGQPLLAHLWVDGFAEWSPQELDLLAALVPRCEGAALTFCLEQQSCGKASWLETWSVVRRTFEMCKQRLE